VWRGVAWCDVVRGFMGRMHTALAARGCVVHIELATHPTHHTLCWHIVCDVAAIIVALQPGSPNSPAHAVIMDGAFPPSRRQRRLASRAASRARLLSPPPSRGQSHDTRRPSKQPILMDRRNSAQRHASKHGHIPPSMKDIMMVSGQPLPVSRPESRSVDPSAIAGAATHRVWEHHNMEMSPDGLACVLHAARCAVVLRCVAVMVCPRMTCLCFGLVSPDAM